MEEIRILHASGLTAFLDAVRTDCARDLGLSIANEPSGSQVACRKVAEPGKPCDLLMLADAELIPALLPGVASFRVDIATDAMVLAVGARAPHVDDIEKDWPSVLRRDDVSLARVDEDVAPTGYRTLMVWRLMDLTFGGDLLPTLRAKPARMVDQVTLLLPLLETGEADYAFIYRSIAIAQSVRHVDLDPRVDLSDADGDYSGARVAVKIGGPQSDRTVRVTARPISWCLTVPDREGLPPKTARFVEWLVKTKTGVLKDLGLVPLVPARLYGPKGGAAVERAAAAWKGLVKYSGTLAD